MIYSVILSMNDKRKTPIFSHYRPDWTNENKPDYNCAQVLLNDRDMLHPGESCHCKLQPAVPELWHNIKVGDKLSCMEGNKKVGEATILQINET